MTQAKPIESPALAVDRVVRLKRGDLQDLCDASEAAVVDGGGFGWLRVPDRQVLERYWQGVLAVPLRTLLVARLDGTIAGSTQLVRPPPNAEAQAYVGAMSTSFVAPWARGHGLARLLVVSLEDLALGEGFKVVQLDVRETQSAAIALYEGMGYRRWGTNPHYARVDGSFVAGHHYAKVLRPGPGP